MNPDELSPDERLVRGVLRELAEREAPFTPDLESRLRDAAAEELTEVGGAPSSSPRQHRWARPLIAAAAVVAMVGGIVAVSTLSGRSNVAGPAASHTTALTSDPAPSTASASATPLPSTAGDSPGSESPSATTGVSALPQGSHNYCGVVMPDANAIGLTVSIGETDEAGLPQYLSVKNNSDRDLVLGWRSSPQLLDNSDRTRVKAWSGYQVTMVGWILLAPGASGQVRISGAPHTDCQGTPIRGGVQKVYFPVSVSGSTGEPPTFFIGASATVDPARYN